MDRKIGKIGTFQEKLVWCILSNTSKVSGTQVGNPGWFWLSYAG
jgi:hypothetical protein